MHSKCKRVKWDCQNSANSAARYGQHLKPGFAPLFHWRYSLKVIQYFIKRLSEEPVMDDCQSCLLWPICIYGDVKVASVLKAVYEQPSSSYWRITCNSIGHLSSVASATTDSMAWGNLGLSLGSAFTAYEWPEDPRLPSHLVTRRALHKSFLFQRFRRLVYVKFRLKGSR